MAGLIPREFIDELMARVDIVEVIDSRVPLKRRGSEYIACCPFHTEKSPSFTVSPAKQFYHCFGCGAHGSALGFLIEFERLAFPEAVRELASQAGVAMPELQAGSSANPEKKGEIDALVEAMAAAQSWFQSELSQQQTAIEYLQNRGVSGEVARDYALGWAPDSWDALGKQLNRFDEKLLITAGLTKRGDRGNSYALFRGRIMFPLRDRRGRVLAFGGRVIADSDGPKYLNSPETPLFHKGRELYGLYEARQASRDIDRLLVVEGYMDVVALAQFGIRYAVATLGTATTADHVKRLYQTSEELVFCFDGDRAGKKAAWKALESALPQLTGMRQLRFLFLPDGEDPDSLVRAEGKQAFEERIVDAQSAVDVLLNGLAAQADPKSLDGQARLAELAKPWCERFGTDTLRELFIEALAQRMNMKSEVLSRQLNKPKQKTQRPPQAPEYDQFGPADYEPDFEPYPEPSYGGYASSKPPKAVNNLQQLHQRTPVRRLLSVLLNHPGLVASLEEVDQSWLQTAAIPGVDILIELLEELARSPNVSTGALLERWRGQPAYSHLAKLATAAERQEQQLKIDHDLSGLEVAQREFNEQWQMLRKHAVEARISELLGLGRSGSLTTEQRQELNALLAQKK